MDDDGVWSRNGQERYEQLLQRVLLIRCERSQGGAPDLQPDRTLGACGGNLTHSRLRETVAVEQCKQRQARAEAQHGQHVGSAANSGIGSVSVADPWVGSQTGSVWLWLRAWGGVCGACEVSSG